MNFFSIADMIRAYNQMPQDEHSQRLTRIFIAAQKYYFERRFDDISIYTFQFLIFYD